MICKIDGRVLGGMQFGVLVDAVLRAHAVWGAAGRVLRASHFCEIDGLMELGC